MLAMVSGAVGFAPNPADGLIFFVEPSRPLAATILQNAEELTLAADARTRSSRSPRCCCSRAAMLSLAGWAVEAADEALRGARMSARRATAPPAEIPAVAAQRRPWRLRDRIGLAFAWALGAAVLRDHRGDRHLHARPGHPATCARSCSSRTRPPGFDRGRHGRLPRPADRHVHRRRDGDGDRRSRSGSAIGVWLSEFGRPFGSRALAESTIEMIAGTPSIVLALFGTLIFQSGALGVPAAARRDGVVFGRSFFAAAAMLSLIALPLIVANVREGLQAIPGHVREASYAVGKTQDRDDAAHPAAGGAAVGRHRRDARLRPRHRRHGDHRGPARRDAALRRAPATTPLLGTLRGTGSTLTTLRLPERAHRRGQPADEGVRGRRSCC